MDGVYQSQILLCKRYVYLRDVRRFVILSIYHIPEFYYKLHHPTCPVLSQLAPIISARDGIWQSEV